MSFLLVIAAAKNQWITLFPLKMTIDVGLNPPCSGAQAHPHIIFGAKIWVKIFFDRTLFSLTIDDVICGDDSHELSPKCSDQWNRICPDPGYVYPGSIFSIESCPFLSTQICPINIQLGRFSLPPRTGSEGLKYPMFYPLCPYRKCLVWLVKKKKNIFKSHINLYGLLVNPS